MGRQSTDAENSKPAPTSTDRDSDRKSETLGSVPSIATKSNSGQQHITGSGAAAVTASIK